MDCKTQPRLLTTASDQIILVNKSNEAYEAERFYLENLSPAPTREGINNRVLSAKCVWEP